MAALTRSVMFMPCICAAFSSISRSWWESQKATCFLSSSRLFGMVCSKIVRRLYHGV